MSYKQYIKVLLFIVGFMSVPQVSADEIYGRLVGIRIDSPGKYKVTVRTSESNRTSVLTLNDGSKPNPQDREYDITQIKEMNFVVPWKGWDGDQTIHVRVYNKDGSIRNQAEITDRNGNIWVHDPQQPIGTDIKRILKYECWKIHRGHEIARGYSWESESANTSCEDTTDFNREWRPKGDQLFTLRVNSDGQIVE